MDFETDVGSSTSGTAHTPPQNLSKMVGAPYRKRAKNAVLKDPTLKQVMGSKGKALDVRSDAFSMRPDLTLMPDTA